ncbi:Uncharacterised protein [Mycobacteroides abscessus subsp. abscessus]|nr:Uncharacterised protein [Mycobacteroides abscessus subsp. abscessus]
MQLLWVTLRALLLKINLPMIRKHVVVIMLPALVSNLMRQHKISPTRFWMVCVCYWIV